MFAQMAVAACDCTTAQATVMSGVGPCGISGADVTRVRAAVIGLAAGVLGHAAMDPAAPNLCAAHCQSGQQNADGKPSLSMTASIPTGVYPRALAIPSADIQRASVAPGDPPRKADSPHAIPPCGCRI